MSGTKNSLAAYREFSSRVETLRNQGLIKSERVKHVFETKIGKISKSDISKLCPDISITTIEKALSELLKEGYIIKICGGRSTAYTKTMHCKLHIQTDLSKNIQEDLNL